MTSTFRSAALLASCLSFAAHAQTTAPAAVPATTVQVPPNDCQNPGSAPIDKAGSDMTRFAKRVDEYKICINKYVTATRAKYSEYDEQARAYSDASNKAVEEYNAYILKLNDAQKAK